MWITRLYNKVAYSRYASICTVNVVFLLFFYAKETTSPRKLKRREYYSTLAYNFGIFFFEIL